MIRTNTTVTVPLMSLVESDAAAPSSRRRLDWSKASLEAALSGNKQAFSVFLPQLSFSSDAGKEVIDSPSTRTSGLDEQRETRQKATLTLTQNLFSGGSNVASYESANKQADLARLGLATTENSILRTVIFCSF